MEKATQDVTTGALGVRKMALENQVPCSMFSTGQETMPWGNTTDLSVLPQGITGRFVVCPGATPGPGPKHSHM